MSEDEWCTQGFAWFTEVQVSFAVGMDFLSE